MHEAPVRLRGRVVTAAFVTVASLITISRADELLVRGFVSGTFLRYDDASGAFLATIDSNLPGANSVVRGPDGDLFASHGANEIRRYDGETGALRGRLVWDDPATPEDESHGLDHATGVTFGPDGNLYAAGYVSNSVIRYDGRTGAFIDVFVQGGAGGLVYPTGLLFSPHFRVRLGVLDPGIAAQFNSMTVDGATPIGTIAFVVGRTPGPTPVPGCAGVALDLGHSRIVGTAVADASGLATLTRFVPARFSGRRVDVQAIERSSCRASRLVSITFP